MSNPAILEAQADFSLNLLHQLSVNNGGVSTILSPVSVAVALAMVYAGAKNKTAEQMAQLLANGAPEAQIHEHFGALLRQMQTGSEHYALEVANRVYTKSGFPILEAFKAAIGTHYGGQFEAVDFLKGVETAKKINDFVEKATHDRIRNLISPDMLNNLTRLVLVNAIYFKGTWVDQFQEHRTIKEPFHVAEGVQKELDMMHNKKKFIYFEDENIQLLGMPYVGNEVFMFIVLPMNKFGLAEVLANLTGGALLELLQKRHKQEVKVTLPKFKLESTHDLNEPLMKLGIPNAFSGANFEGITEAEPLVISKVIQKAFIEVNEEGTEAAAATGVVMARCLSMPIGQAPPEFIADHPFALFLVSAGADVLFNGIFSG